MAKARITQLSTTDASIVNKLVGSQKDRGKGSLAALRDYLKQESRTGSGQKTQAVLKQIQSKYGKAEFQKAVRDFNLTFQGIQQSPAEGKHPQNRIK